MKAIETTGRVDKNGNLRLDTPLPPETDRVKIIVLIPEGDEITDGEWLKSAARNPAFDFLNDAGEDVYTLKDGTPL